jgi:FAD synthase
MLALLTQRGPATAACPTCVLTFEPHPRDFFARAAGAARARPGAHLHAARQASANSPAAAWTTWW